MELHNLKDRLVLLKEYGKLDYEWEKLYAGSLVIKNPTEDLDAFIEHLRKDINDDENFGKYFFNRFSPPEFNDIKFIIIHKANIESTKEYIDFKDKFQYKIKNQNLINKAEDWIAQFPFFDWKIYALKLLSNIIYLDDDKIEKKLTEIKKYMGALDDFVISDLEGVAKSSAHLFYPLNKILEMSSKNFIPSKDLKLSDNRDIVFIDDMIGTGSQAINYIRKLKDGGKIGSRKLYYYAIVGLEGGIRRLKDSGLLKNVSATVELPKRAFDSGYIFTVEDSGTAKEMASIIGEQLTKNMKDIGPLGYDNSEALVFFRHNTPNNSLPIFWASGMCKILNKVGESTEVKWNPLFPRKEKPKSGPKLTGEHVNTDTQAIIEPVPPQTEIPIIQPPVVKISVPALDYSQTNKTEVLREIQASQSAQSGVSIDQPRHPPSLHFITPPDPGFVGRDEFLSEISAWYETSQVRVGALVGLGGTGKSSIARKWFDQLRDQAAYVQKVFWWGFYQNSSLDECLNRLLEYISDNRISPAEYARPIDKINMIKTSLHHHECLVVFDGFEAIQMRSAVGPQDAGHAAYNYLGELLKSFAESTGKAFLLVTTRYGLDELRGYEGAQYRAREIVGLTLEDAITLFKQFDIRAENHEVETVWQEFEGHALSLRLLTTFLQEYYNSNIHAIQEIPGLTSYGIEEYKADEFDGGKARRILVWYDRKLSEAQRIFLKIFSLFAKPVTQTDFLSVFQTKDERLRNESLVSLSNIAFANLIKKLIKLHLLTARKENGKTIYETHPLIKEYFSSLIGKEAPTWHQALTEYYESIIVENDYDLVLRDRQIIHHALRSKNYQSAVEASDRLLPYLKDSISQNGTIGLIRLYHVTSTPLSGTSYKEVYKKACRTYTRLRGGETQWIHIMSAYFNNEEVDFDYFWDRVSKKSFKERRNRVRLLPCAIELIRNSRIEPFSKQNQNRPFEIIHRFLGITRSNDLFFVQVNEDTKTGKKYFMSVFPER